MVLWSSESLVARRCPQKFQRYTATITFMPSNFVESMPCSSGKPPLVSLESWYLQIISHLQGSFIMEREDIWNFEEVHSRFLCLGMIMKQRLWNSLWFSPDSATWLHNLRWVTCVLCIYKIGSMIFVKNNLNEFQ